jgi:hypothetical protein
LVFLIPNLISILPKLQAFNLIIFIQI